MKAHWRYLIARYGALPWFGARRARPTCRGIWPRDFLMMTESRYRVDGGDALHARDRSIPSPDNDSSTGIGRLSARRATDDFA